MSITGGKGNQGIIVTGGSIQTHDLAVGENASINKIYQGDNEASQVIQNLRTELDKLINIMEKDQIDSGKIEAVKSVKKELENSNPNMFLVKPVLHSVIESIKKIGAFAGSVLSIKKILDLLL